MLSGKVIPGMVDVVSGICSEVVFGFQFWELQKMVQIDQYQKELVQILDEFEQIG